MKILVINGPNLDMTGERDSARCGNPSLTSIEKRMEERAGEYGWELEFHRTNHEGEIVDLIYGARLDCDAVILNAGAYSHYSLAIRDAVEAVSVPVIEVHMSNLCENRDQRGPSVIAPVCRGLIAGFGAASYILAMEALVEIVD